MSGVNKATGYTLYDEEKCEFTWKVGSLRYLIDVQGANLTSPMFSTKSGVKFYFTLVAEAHKVYTSSLARNIYLHCKNPVYPLRCDYWTSVSGIHRGLYKNGFAILKANKESSVQIAFDEKQYLISSESDAVTVYCKLLLSRGKATSFLDSGSMINESKTTTSTTCIPKLKFDWVFLDKSLSDVKLQTACGKEIPAHRLMLAAASPVFKAMFSHDMLENKIQSVNIADISYEVAVEMLRFIYTGSVENDEIPLIIDLLAAADKYELEELQNKCEEILSSKLSTKNAIDILKVADKCSMKNLKENVIEFMKIHINQSPDSNDIGDMILSMERFFLK